MLHDLTFEVQRGEILGYVGPNGSGKTTTLKILIGLLCPDAGEVRVLGQPLADRSLALPGRLPARAPVSLRLPDAREYLDYVGRLFGLAASARRERTRELLALVGLERSADSPMRRFSKGMVQRAGLAQALVNDPELLILDEPMSGLDPIGRRLVRNLILDLQEGGQDRPLLHPHPLATPRRCATGWRCCGRAGSSTWAASASSCASTSRTWRSSLSGTEPAALRRRRAPRRTSTVGDRHRLEVDEKALGGVIRAVEEAGGRILVGAAGAAVARGLLLPGDGGRAHGARRGEARLSRIVAVAANTFRETVRERVLYNLVFFAIADDPLRPAARAALDPAGREDHQGRRPRRHGPVRHR